jgi:lipoprotein NlpI
MSTAFVLALATCLLPQDPRPEAAIIRLMQTGKFAEAETAADKVIAANDKSAIAYKLRGQIRDATDKLQGAIQDFTAALALDLGKEDRFAVLDSRGNAHFKQGEMKEAIEDFDACIKLQPNMEPQHWRRGIAYYYAGRFDEGQKQFEHYQNVDGNDVENVVWRFLCMARREGVARARQDLWKVGPDRRVPMTTIYELFKGTAKPEDVMAAAQVSARNPGEAQQRLFYAHLYLALYGEATGAKQAEIKDHLSKAVAIYSAGPYMWSVARVHLKRLEKPD